MKKIEFYDGVWVEDPDWICTIDDRDITLGVFFKITDLLDAGCFENDSPEAATPWIVESMIYPHPKELTTRFILEMGGNPKEPCDKLVGDMIDYASGVPFNTQAIMPANEKTERIPGIEMPAGIEMPLFKTEDEAKEFCEKKIPILPAVFGLIGLFLDAPVNRLGESGWNWITYMVTEKRRSAW